MRFRFLTLALALILLSSGTIFGQAVSLDHVDGLNASGEIIPGEVVTFYIRLTNGAEAQSVINNGYRVYSPDGATWSPMVGTLNPSVSMGLWILSLRFRPFFDLGMYINYFTTDQFPTLLDLAEPPVCTAQVFLLISMMSATGLLSARLIHAHAGKTIVLDSSWFSPAGRWVWATVADQVAWDGPHTFVVEGGSTGEAPLITSTPVTAATIDQPYTYDVEATGDPVPTYALTTAPAGMAIDGASGVISWTPGAVGDFPVVVEANNTEGTDTQSFTVTVSGVAPAFTSTPITTGTYGVAYSYDADASGNPAPTFALTTFPAGMTIDAAGLVSWTPDGVGDFDVVIEASNVAGTAVQSFTITVGGIAPSFTSTPVTDRYLWCSLQL